MTRTSSQTVLAITLTTRPMLAMVLPVQLGVAVPGLSEQSLMMLSHVAMIGGMVVWMIYRFEHYAQV